MADAVAEVELMFNLEKAKASVKTFLEQVNKSAQVQYKELVSGIQQGVFGSLAKGFGAISGKKDDSGTKLFGKLIGEVALLGIVFGKAIDILGGIWDQLVASSPALKSVANQFGIALNLFFKPFGDFLASLLRPAVQQLLIYSVNWNRFWNKWLSLFGTEEKPTALGEATGVAAETAMTPGGFLAVLAKQLGEEIANNIPAFFEALQKFDLGKWIEETIPMVVEGVFNIGEWLYQQISNFIQGVFDLGIWLGQTIGTFLEGAFNFGVWIGKNILSFFTENLFNFGTWLDAQIKSFFEGKFNFAEWLTKSISNFIVGVFDLGKWIGDNIGSFIQGAKTTGGGIINGLIGGATSFVQSIAKGFKQTGAEYIADEGLYYLHRGESVLNSSSGGEAANMTFNNYITLQASVSNNMDLDRLSRELAEKLNVELRRKVNYGRGFT